MNNNLKSISNSVDSSYKMALKYLFEVKDINSALAYLKNNKITSYKANII